ncbi:MAG TPA: hypothetical protein VH025_09745 [Solirubrobacteraceae bacterium]|jgi:hypothetical protein|nr:hypothetical protein [Solirubrobacteraceae bacterium]
MQYVDGPDLGVLLQRDGALSLAQALEILGPIGDAPSRKPPSSAISTACSRIALP